MAKSGWVVVLVASVGSIAALGGCGSDESAADGGESTLALCSDSADNDGDGFVDCDDQDCGIFAVCVDSDSDSGGADSGDASDADAGGDAESDAAPDGGSDTGPDTVQDAVEDTGADAAADADAAPDSSADTSSDVDAGPTTPCPDHEWCVEVAFTTDRNLDVVNGVASTNTLVPLIGQRVEFLLPFNVATTNDRPPMFGGGAGRDFITPPMALQTVDGAPTVWTDTIVPKLDGGTAQFGLQADLTGTGTSVLVQLSGTAGSESFTLEFSGSTLPFPLDESGYPLLGPVEVASSACFVRRFEDLFGPGEVMTDFAEATATWTIYEGGLTR